MNKALTTVLNISEEMLLSGAEISRVEESINKMGLAFGAARVDAFIITSSMQVTMQLENGESYTQTRRIMGTGTNIEKLHRLNALSRDICNLGLSVEEAQERFLKIKALKPYPFILETLSYSVIACAFSLFFGGGTLEAVFAFIIGAILSVIFTLASAKGTNKIFARLISSFATCILALVLFKTGIIPTADNVIIGNIMLLIPGVGITVALRDLFVGDNVSGLLRTIEVVLFALAIAGGYFLAAFILKQYTYSQADGNTNAIIQIVTGFLGSSGFAILYNVRGRRFIFASLGGLISWSTFLILGFIIPNEIVRYFLVSLIISIYAEIMARALKTPTTTFIMTSLIPLIPGGALYYTMATALSGNLVTFVEKGIITLGYAGALAAGIIVIAGFMKAVNLRKKAK